MSLADARCSVVNAQALAVAGAVTAGSVNADIIPIRILSITSGSGGATSYNSVVVPGLTLNAFVFVQQAASGAVPVPVVVDTYEPGGTGTGFVIRIAAASAFPANCLYDCYIARY